MSLPRSSPQVPGGSDPLRLSAGRGAASGILGGEGQTWSPPGPEWGRKAAAPPSGPASCPRVPVGWAQVVPSGGLHLCCWLEDPERCPRESDRCPSLSPGALSSRATLPGRPHPRPSSACPAPWGCCEGLRQEVGQHASLPGCLSLCRPHSRSSPHPVLALQSAGEGQCGLESAWGLGHGVPGSRT